MTPDLARLYRRAASFDELVSDAFVTRPASRFQSNRAKLAVLGMIREHYAGDHERYRQRIEAGGLSVTSVVDRIANPAPRPDAVPPLWLTDIPDILSALGRADMTLLSSQPFQRAFAGLLEHARGCRDRSLSRQALERLSASAGADLDQLLLARLIDLATPVLYRSFDRYRAGCGRPPAPHSTTIYRAFIDHMARQGWRRMLKRKPVMFRLMATIVRQWIDASAEFLTRLNADAEEIARFLNLKSLPPLTTITGHVSDPHNHGRAVFLLAFADGQRLCYKPKSLTVDRAWAELTARFNSLSPPATLGAPRTLEREGYGWCEFIASAPLAEPAAARSFFYRSGGLLALMHATGATDVHEENIIASGDQPIPIDLETALQPARRMPPGPADPDAAFGFAFERLAQSVLAVGLLPAPRSLAHGRVALMGGLNDRNSAARVPRLDPVNTDTMRPMHEETSWTPLHNLPVHDGRRIALSAHADAFIEGFSDTLRFLAQPPIRSALIATLEPYGRALLRVILKPTQFYMMVMEHLLDHRRMANGLIWSSEAETLTAMFPRTTDDPFWPLAVAERNAMTRLDVPFFSAAADSIAVSDCDGHSAVPLARSALDHLRDRFQQLTPEHIATQCAFARFAVIPVTPAAPAGGTGETAIVGAGDYFGEARRIADRLAEAAIVADNSATWISAETLGDTLAQTLNALSPTLYSGSAGIALFLACEARATGDCRHVPLVLKALAPLRAMIANKEVPAQNLGASGGLASAIYTLTRVAELTGHPDLLDDALRAARLATPPRFETNQEHDLLGGSAGLILALLALGRACPDPWVIDNAERLAERAAGAEPLALTGFAHGNASLAFALAQVAERSGNPDLWSSVERLLDAEDSHFAADACNWADLRAHVPPAHRFSQSQWCHGAAGIALSRALLSRHAQLDQSRIRRDLDAALDAMRRRLPRTNDTLCCGNLGIAVILDATARATDRPDLAAEAHRLAAAVVARARAHGDYRWAAGSGEFNLGLFQGIAGVGYAMLRMAQPTLPLVLALS
jgi:type 2 lantibiotic biosynthesis protein LanM